MTKIERVWLEERVAGPTIGIGDRAPRISWTTALAASQVAYEIEIAGSPEGTVSTGRIESPQSRLIAWPGELLGSRANRLVRVRIWDGDGVGDWSDWLEFETGLLDPMDWSEDFVSPSTSESTNAPRPGFLLRAQFDVDRPFVRARVYATAHGVYSLEVNGTDTSNDLLSPGWTSYRHRLRYQTHDVTALIHEGTNVLGGWLGDGWYRGRIGFNGGRWDNYGMDVALLAQLELTSADGTVSIVPLGESWRWSESPITAVGLYEGETFDARLAPIGWSQSPFDDASWAKPTILSRSNFEATIEAPDGPPVRPIERLSAVSVDRLVNGRIRLDFGQNIAGKLEITLDAPAGHAVRLHHAEELENGELAIRPLRGAASIDTYVSRGTGVATWTPRFTIHGFRYAELENWPAAFDASQVSALVVHTDMRRTGWFESSDSRLNQLHSNIVWSMRDNFVDLPTDCPQRDERLGWTGDIQVFAPTASFLYSVYGTLQGWLRDVSAEQRAFGSVPNFVPWIEVGFPSDPAAAWGDAAVVVPWVLYERTGDTAILQQQYDGMVAWVEQMASLAGERELWDEGFQLGDWLDPAAPPDDPAASTTDKYLVATAYRARSTRILSRVAQLLGRTADAKRYGDMADRVTAAFQREYVTPNGRLASDTTTAYSLALTFDLLTAEQRIIAGSRLAVLVAQAGYHISTGFVGTPIVCDALAETGSIDVAYHLLMQEECPSWLYPVTMGATTVWERWDSMLPDGSINPGEMTSFNHYALGAVADFMHRVVAGLAPAAPGYRKLRIAPQPGGGLRSARASHETPYGLAESSWTRNGSDFHLEIEVPPGCEAFVLLPGEVDGETVGAGRHVFDATVRLAAEDPTIPEPFNIHNPAHRAARAAAV
jgi:alpha-L-rhamnosidase